MHTSRLVQSIAAFGMLFGVTQIAHANLISNGSFESGIYAPPSNDTMSLSVGATNMTGWTVVSDAIAWIGPSSPWSLTASTGDFFLDLTDYSFGAPFGGVSQTVSTTPGQAYQLSFDLGSSNLWSMGPPKRYFGKRGVNVSHFYERFNWWKFGLAELYIAIYGKLHEYDNFSYRKCWAKLYRS